MKAFIFVGSAHKDVDNKTEYNTTGCVIHHVANENEAIGIAWKRVNEKFPAAYGWQGHRVEVAEIDPVIVFDMKEVV